MNIRKPIQHFTAVITGLTMAFTSCYVQVATAVTYSTSEVLITAEGNDGDAVVQMEYESHYLAYNSEFLIKVNADDTAEQAYYNITASYYDENGQEKTKYSSSQAVFDRDYTAAIRYIWDEPYVPNKITVMCNVMDKDGKPATNRNTYLTLSALREKVETHRIYTGKRDADGNELDMEIPGEKPQDVSLCFIEAPRSTYPKTTYSEELQPEGLRVALVEKYSYHEVWYDVSNHLLLSGQTDLSREGTRTATIRTSYVTEGGFGREAELEYKYFVFTPDGTKVTPKYDVSTGIITGTTEATTRGTVTNGGYYPEHTNIMSTNAYWGSILKITEYPKTMAFPVGTPLNTDGLKVILTENRSYNQCDYDVSEYLDIETDYDPKTPGKYTVWVSTPYQKGELSCDAVVSFEVMVYAVSSQTTTTSSSTTITTTTSSDLQKLNEMGDLNGDGDTNVKDVVLLSKYLLAEKVAFANPKKADMDGNGKLNAVDLTLLKRLVMEIERIGSLNPPPPTK